MNPTMQIGKRRIGKDQPAFIVAEIGVNHDGRLDRALELVHIARACGADAVKLQLFTANHLMSDENILAEYQKTRVRETDGRAMLRRFEMPDVDVAMVVAATRAAGMVPLATPFSLNEVDRLVALGLDAIKIASPDVVNKPLLQKAALTGLPMFVSCGAANMEEVERAVHWLRMWETSAVLMHCVSSYPVDDSLAHVRWVDELRQFGLPVGYSDHATDILSGALGVAAGACVIERHLTYDRSADGPDHSASSDPVQFAEYVRTIRRSENLLGRGPKHVLDTELDVRKVSRQSVVARVDLVAGQPIRIDELCIQRPGTGIPAAELEAVVGRKARANVTRGRLLHWEMIH